MKVGELELDLELAERPPPPPHWLAIRNAVQACDIAVAEQVLGELVVVDELEDARARRRRRARRRGGA